MLGQRPPILARPNWSAQVQVQHMHWFDLLWAVKCKVNLLGSVGTLHVLLGHLETKCKDQRRSTIYPTHLQILQVNQTYPLQIPPQVFDVTTWSFLQAEPEITSTPKKKCSDATNGAPGRTRSNACTNKKVRTGLLASLRTEQEDATRMLLFVDPARPSSEPSLISKH